MAMGVGTVQGRPVLYALHPRQEQAMQLLGLDPRYPAANPVEELLFGGQGGGGKSKLARALGVYLCSIWPGATIPIFRRTYPRLEDTHIRAIQVEVPSSIAEYNDRRHELKFRANGSMILFRHCQTEEDVLSYMSSEWDALIIDEATEFTPYQVTTLRSRVRSPVGKIPDWRRVILYTANPGRVGHAYFRDGFVHAAPESRLFRAPTNEGGLRRCFLRSRLEDNPSLGGDYRQVLEGIADPELRRAMLDGDWDIFAGQYFSEWRREQHTCAWFEIPPHWTERRIAVDFGFGAPWACLYLVRDEDVWRHHRIPRWYCYREHYGPGVRDEEQAAMIAAAVEQDEALWAEQVDELRQLGEPRPSGPIEWRAIADPSMWNHQANGTSIADVYARYGVRLTRANNDRVAGWQRLHGYLAQQEDGCPGLIVFDTCPELIRTLPALIHDDRRVEDCDSSGEDHAPDALRYGIMSVDPLRRRPTGPPRHAVALSSGPPPEETFRNRPTAAERRRRLDTGPGRHSTTIKRGH